MEATVQLLLRLLPLAGQGGLRSAEHLVDALRAHPSGDRELSYTFDLNEVFNDYLLETVGWRPDEETVEDALQRWGAAKRQEREARYATMTEAHRTAHRTWDPLIRGDYAVETWEPLLAELEQEHCDELADACAEWARQCDHSVDGRRCEFRACRGALAAALGEPAVARSRVEPFVFSLMTAAGRTAGGLERAISVYRELVEQLVHLPPCGECDETGEFEAGCLAGRPCQKACLGRQLVWAVELETRSSRTYDRLSAALTPILEHEHDPGPLADLAGCRVRRYADAGRVDEAWAAWSDAQDFAVSTGRVDLIDRQLSSAVALLVHHKRFGNVVTALGPLASSGTLWHLRNSSRLSDTLARCYERLGLMDDAVAIWERAITEGTTE